MSLWRRAPRGRHAVGAPRRQPAPDSLLSTWSASGALAVASAPVAPPAPAFGAPGSWIESGALPVVPSYAPVDPPEAAAEPAPDAAAALTETAAAPRLEAPAAPVPGVPPAPLGAPAAPAPVVPPAPRVELTFTDGSTAELDDDQATALQEMAQLLTGRNGVKH